MKEKAFSLSGDDFTVKTISGLEICKCKGKMLSLSDKKGQSGTDIPVPLSLANFLDWYEGPMLADAKSCSVYGCPRQRALRLEK